MKETSVIRNRVIYQTQKALSQKCQAFLWTKSVTIWHCFLKQQQAVHHIQLVCLSFTWQETPESLGTELSAKLNLRRASVVLLYGSEDRTGLSVCTDSRHFGCFSDVFPLSICFVVQQEYLSPAMAIVILENKMNQCKLLIPKLEL